MSRDGFDLQAFNEAYREFVGCKKSEDEFRSFLRSIGYDGDEIHRVTKEARKKRKPYCHGCGINRPEPSARLCPDCEAK